MKIALCDDNTDILNFLENQIAIGFGKRFQLLKYDSASKLWEAWSNPDNRADIIIMDILFPDENGVNAAKKIQALYSDTKVIFITGYPELASQIFRAAPTFLLIKPISPDLLFEAVSTAEQQLQLENDRAIPVSFNGTVKRIKPSSIYYIEHESRHVIIHWTGGDFVTRQSMDTLEAMLPSESFMRIHKSYLVNMDYIVEYNYSQLMLSNEKVLYISRTKAKAVRKKFLDYLKRH